jgi:hypothetical protein
MILLSQGHRNIVESYAKVSECAAGYHFEIPYSTNNNVQHFLDILRGKRQSEVWECWNTIYSFQRALARLEKGGIIVSHKEGKTLIYQFNPRYPFLKELKTFLKKAYEFFPDEIREQYYEPISRKRPRRQGKPL